MAEFRSCSAIDGDSFRKGLYSRLSTATSIMDEQYRESLHRHYHLLMTHIILTDDVIQQMANEKILPDTMIKDIQSGETREERNERLLNALRLRGNKSYKKFRELMYRTGNFFVADLLWGKIREKALLLAWKQNPQERIDTLRNKVVDFNQEKVFRDTISSQEQKLKTLESVVDKEREKNNTLRLEIDSLKQQMDHLKRDHRASTETQLRFHDANISTIARFKDRLGKVRERVMGLTEEVRGRLEPGTELTASSESPPPSDNEEMDFRVAMLEGNTRRILRQLNHTQDEMRKLKSEREDVLKLLGRRYSKDPLTTVIKDVLKHEQKHRGLVMRDILRLNDVLKQVVPGSAPLTTTPTISLTLPDPSTLDTKHFKSQLALLKAEAEHIQKRFQWKENEIINLKQEVLTLKHRLDDYGFTSPTAITSADTVSPIQPPNTPASTTHHVASSSTQNSPRSAPSGTNRPRTASASSLDRSPTTQRKKSPFKRSQSSKTVTFKTTVLDRNSEMGKTDLDKTHINVDKYLEEEVKEEEEESESEDKGDEFPSDLLQTIGDGDKPRKSKTRVKSAFYAAYATRRFKRK